MRFLFFFSPSLCHICCEHMYDLSRKRGVGVSFVKKLLNSQFVVSCSLFKECEDGTAGAIKKRSFGEG